MHILNRVKIEHLLKSFDLCPLREEGFEAYSFGKTMITPIEELSFKDPLGDVYIKYGYIKKDKYYVIKIASGFLENDKYGIPNG